MGLGVARDGDVLELSIYEDIVETFLADYGLGISSAQVREALAKNSFSTIRVRLNCYGGDVFEGMAIYNLLRQHKAKVQCVVDGIAASAASLVAMAGDEIVMAEPGEMMVHDAWAWGASGDAEYLRSIADRLERHNASLANVYAARSGQTEDKMLELMAAETWLTASEALELGLCTSVVPAKGAESDDDEDEDADEEESREAASARPRALDARGYKNVPERALKVAASLRMRTPRIAAHAAPRPEPITPPPEAEQNQPQPGEEITSMKLSKEILGALGVTEDADQAAIESAIAKMTAASSVAQAQSTELARRVASLETAQMQARVNATVERLSKAGKLPPSLHEWARTQTVESLEAFAKDAPTGASTSDDGSPVPVVTEPTSARSTLLTEEEMIVCKSLSISQKDFIEQKKLNAERAAERAQTGA